MALSIGRIDIQDQGVNWKVEIDWSNDGQQTWHTYIANFPSAFTKLSVTDTQPLMVQLAVAAGMNDGSIPKE